MKIIISCIVIIFIFQIKIFCQSEKNCTSSDCHASVISFNNIHPAANEDCLNCHEETNSATHPSSAVTDFSISDPVPDLCFYCHDEPDETKKLHLPFEDGDCLDCHSPHSSSAKFLLTENSIKETCNQCHDIPTGNKSLHKPAADGNCTYCHSPHQSDKAKLLKKETNELCYSCHNEMDVDLNNYTVHSPFEDDCTECHNPHDSENQKLLMAQFPEGNYAQGIVEQYSLCFSCHDEEKITIEESEDVTDFRNGNKNLHFVHVNKEKSRSCINCHNVHFGKNEFLIVEEVSFESWKMKLNFEVKENGGSCLPGCHEQKEYTRK